MKVLTKENFLEFLIKRDAYQSHLTWAQSQASARDIVEKCPSVNHIHWLIRAIGGALHVEYDEKTAPFLAEYEEKVAQLLAEYDELIAPLKAECEKKVTPFRAEYMKKCYTIAREICTFEKVQKSIGS